jgi:hypothetical protein
LISTGGVEIIPVPAGLQTQGFEGKLFSKQSKTPSLLREEMRKIKDEPGY